MMDRAWLNLWSAPGGPVPAARRANVELVLKDCFPGTGLYDTRDDALKAAKSDPVEQFMRQRGVRHLGVVQVDMRGLQT